MSIEPFVAKGERPLWRDIYDLIEDAPIGEVVTYDHMSHRLGRDFRTQARWAWGRALREFEVRKSRTMAVVPKVGYRVVEPGEHRELSLGHSRRSGRQLRRARQRVQAADRELVGPSEAKYLDAMEVALGQVQLVVVGMSRQIARHDELIGKVSERTEAAEARIERIEEKLGLDD